MNLTFIAPPGRMRDTTSLLNSGTSWFRGEQLYGEPKDALQIVQTLHKGWDTLDYRNRRRIFGVSHHDQLRGSGLVSVTR
jgi:hypothetical protein